MSLASDVETIYQTYPRHKDKRFALLSIERALRRLCSGESGKTMTHEQAVEFLLQRVAEFARAPAGCRGQMTPYPATWMNRGSYLDDPDEWFWLTEQERLQNLNNVGVYRP